MEFSYIIFLRLLTDYFSPSVLLVYSTWRSFVLLGPGCGGGNSGCVACCVSGHPLLLLPLGSPNEVRGRSLSGATFVMNTKLSAHIPVGCSDSRGSAFCARP